MNHQSVLVLLTCLAACGSTVERDSAAGGRGGSGGTGGATSAESSTGAGGADEVTPCDGVTGMLPSECVDWLVERCASLEASGCDQQALIQLDGGALGCVAAGPRDEEAACAQSGPTRCVAGLDIGDADFADFLDEGIVWSPIIEEGAPFRPSITYGFEACVGQHVCCGGS